MSQHHTGGSRWIVLSRLSNISLHAASGVTALDPLYPVLAMMERYDLPLLVHGEVTDPDCDIFDREKAFIDTSLVPIRREFPELRIVFEHITTEDAVQFVCESGERTAATITAHHLLYNRNDLLVGGIRPHFFCLPVLKRNRHQLALRAIVASGHQRFFLGTDSAPHTKADKESSCGCAGCYTCLLYTSPSPRDATLSRMPSSA